MKKRTTLLRKFSRAFFALLMVPALTFSVTSCSDDDDDPAKDPNTITDLAKSVSVAADQTTNTATLKFTANTVWEASYASTASEWFTFSPKSGNAGEVTITIEAPYNDGAAKTGELEIKHGTNSYKVTVNQAVGAPDEAVWDATNKDELLNTLFAPDPYNATEEMPSTFTLKITNKLDYATLEEAPFEIMTFLADEMGTPTDSIINWIHAKVAENSPEAKDGKLIEITVDTIDVDVTDSRKNTDNRWAYICIVPKGTQKADMFANGEMKDEYLAKGTSIEQSNYMLTFGEPLLLTGIMDMGMAEPKTSVTTTVTANCRFTYVASGDTHPALENWWYFTQEGNQVTLGYDLEKVRTLPMGGGMAMIMLTFYIDRGKDLQPITFKNMPPAQISYMKMFM